MCGAMLKITFKESDSEILIKLDGRIAGPWVEELLQAWEPMSTRAAGKTTVLDVRDVTYANAEGTALLKRIYEETDAEVLATTPWARAFADEIKGMRAEMDGMEGDDVTEN